MKLILSDGTTISNIGGGPVYYSSKELTDEMFRGKLRGVQFVTEDENGGEIISGPYHLEQIGTVQKRGPYWSVVLQGMTQEKAQLLELQANLTYLSMMSDIDLPA